METRCLREIKVSLWPLVFGRFSALQLESLDVSACNLTELPEGLSTLRRLLHMAAAHNREVKYVPASLCRLPRLRALDLADCGLQACDGMLASVGAECSSSLYRGGPHILSLRCMGG
jgi:Leucine-rich repeat (LRR) protein